VQFLGAYVELAQGREIGGDDACPVGKREVEKIDAGRQGDLVSVNRRMMAAWRRHMT
jgi:hypothetical protein